MMGSKERAFAPLPPVSLEVLIPPDHFYRQLESALDLAFVRDLVRGAYADIGRPSIDPVRCSASDTGKVGVDPLVLDGYDVLDRAVLGVARHLLRAQLPAEAFSPQEIEGWLVLHDLRRRHQGREDNPRPAPVDDVVVVVAQAGAAVGESHRRGVGIGRADAEVGRAPIRAALLRAVRAAGLTDPIVTLGVICSLGPF